MTYEALSFQSRSRYCAELTLSKKYFGSFRYCAELTLSKKYFGSFTNLGPDQTMNNLSSALLTITQTLKNLSSTALSFLCRAHKTVLW